MLIEIHVIQNHAPANLNRDDTGSPKSCNFGGIPRARISSQCLKRSIRKSTFFEEKLAIYGKSWLTTVLPKLLVAELRKQGMVDEKVLIAAETFAKDICKSKTKDSDDTEDKDDTDDSKGKETKNVIFVTELEVRELATQIIAYTKKPVKVEAEGTAPKKGKKDGLNAQLKKNIKIDAIITPAIALFGRMLTQDTLKTVESSLQVAHAISTNRIEQEFDYFTAVDDLTETTGASMIGDVEFNSSCFYKYFSIDTDKFLENYKKPEALKAVIGAMLMAIAHVTPTGKQNSFAAHNPPDVILVEVRAQKTPISYANAFISPVRATEQRDIVESSIIEFNKYIDTITTKFGLQAKKRLWFSTRNFHPANVIECQKFDDLVNATVATLS